MSQQELRRRALSKEISDAIVRDHVMLEAPLMDIINKEMGPSSK
jgi:hypothetical protein